MYWLKLSLLFLPTVLWLCCRWKAVSIADDKEKIRYSLVARFVAWLVFVLAPAVPTWFAIILSGKRELDTVLIFACCAAAFALLMVGLYVWRETRYGYVIVTPASLQRFSPWWGTTELAWKQVVTAEVTPRGSITLSGPEGARLTFFPYHWSGMETLTDAVDRHVQPGAFVGRS